VNPSDNVGIGERHSNRISNLTEEELFDAMSGLHAYYEGCVGSGIVGSGIHDELLRARVKEELKSIRLHQIKPGQIFSDRFSALMARYINRHFLGEEALKAGYGFEDLLGFIRWLGNDMGME